MKKTILALAFLVFTGSAVSAQSGAGNRITARGQNKNCPAYVDANKDGICDNSVTKLCYNKQGRGQGRYCQGYNSQGGQQNGMGRRTGMGRGRNASL